MVAGKSAGLFIGYGRRPSRSRSHSGLAAVKTGCFTAGTPVLLADGISKPIEQITARDKVTAYNSDTGQTETGDVVRTFVHYDVPTYDVTLTTGETVTTTQEHPFWVQGQGWTPARNLRAGDPLRTPNGTTITISSVGQGPAAATVYNFEVTNTHTYYVHTGTTWALVHNTCALVKRAEELAARAGKNRVSVETPSGRLSVDLRGRAHYERSTKSSVATPHVKFETRHVGPNGRDSYTSGPVRPATHADLRIVDRILTKRGL